MYHPKRATIVLFGIAVGCTGITPLPADGGCGKKVASCVEQLNGGIEEVRCYCGEEEIRCEEMDFLVAAIRACAECGLPEKADAAGCSQCISLSYTSTIDYRHDSGTIRCRPAVVMYGYRACQEKMVEFGVWTPEKLECD